MSASISIARSSVPVSVEKYGCPIPPAKKTISPFSSADTAASFENSSVNAPTWKGVITCV